MITIYSVFEDRKSLGQNKVEWILKGERIYKLKSLQPSQQAKLYSDLLQVYKGEPLITLGSHQGGGGGGGL